MAKQVEGTPKVGAGHASGMWRQGLSEIRGALYNDGTVAQPTQYGIYGTKTPGEVQEEREASVPTGSRDAEPVQEQGSILDQHMAKAEARIAIEQQQDRGVQEREGPERE